MPRLHLLLAGLLMLATSPGTLAEQTFSDAPETMAGAPTLSQLSVDGNRFINADGDTVVLRGLSLSDPWHLERQGHWNRAYFEAARAWNAELVRIPVHPGWWREAGHEQYLQWLDQGVQWAGELGMYVIIDWHTIGNPLTGVPHRPNYLTTQEETYYFWHLVANRYRGNPVVAFYELFNEPTNRGGEMGRLPWPEYKAYIEGLVDMIFHIDDTAIPLVAGFDWAYSLEHVRDDPIDFDGIAYVSHPYPQKREPPWQNQWEADWGYVADTYPVIVTEFGYMAEGDRGAHIPVLGDDTYGKAITDYMADKGISWTAWVFDPRWTPNLFTDWDYTPTMQGEFFKKVLAQ
ncbi:glycoside hydrolase family 5 protein [Marinihelvus fidelis]|uniref:Glycoside hydrolase family 5 protein n=1 Tax=Marinihelvus fidelis TaxID=2613842 RepID=A0A5N0TEU9_9GAMM|nr:cellulase family glycosylhydrolase [Marinihelvus fidelis]KAA9132637.1 glycoside hydrolase family 5 protein [Marinihelvus fidelis]